MPLSLPIVDKSSFLANQHFQLNEVNTLFIYFFLFTLAKHMRHLSRYLPDKPTGKKTWVVVAQRTNSNSILFRYNIAFHMADFPCLFSCAMADWLLIHLVAPFTPPNC